MAETPPDERQQLCERIKSEHLRLCLGEISLLDYRASQEEFRIALHALNTDAIQQGQMPDYKP